MFAFQDLQRNLPYIVGPNEKIQNASKMLFFKKAKFIMFKMDYMAMIIEFLHFPN